MRLLGLRNVAAIATYRNAIAVAQAVGARPDVEAVRRAGHTKMGVGLNAEQEISKNVGLFVRISYNDGKNETWALTEIGQSTSLGVVSTGGSVAAPR